MSAIGQWSILGDPLGWFDTTAVPTGWLSPVLFSPSKSVRGVKVFLDGAFVSKPLKMWNGAQWIVVPVKVWTGTAWS